MKRLIIFAVVLLLLLSACGSSDTVYTDPFGHIYRVEAVLFAADEGASLESTQLVNLDPYHFLMIMSDTSTYSFCEIGQLQEFQHDEPNEVQKSWSLEKDEQRYEMNINSAGEVILSYAEKGIVQWEYLLSRVDTVRAGISYFGTKEHLELDWFYEDTFPGNLDILSGTTIYGDGKIGFTVEDEATTSLTVFEEYYTDGKAEYREYSLSKEDGFHIDVSRRYEDAEQYALYRIPYENGDTYSI